MSNWLNVADQKTPIWKLILTLAWPSVIEQLLQTIVNYIDTAMLGSIGVQETAAVGVVSSTIFFINRLMNSFSLGFSVLVARRMGAGDFAGAKEIVRQAVLSVLVIGALLTSAIVFVVAPNLPIWMNAEPDVADLSTKYFRIFGSSYLFNTAMVICSGILRSMGDTKTPLKCNLLTNLINVVGNYLLIYPTSEITFLGRRFTLYRAGLGIEGAALASALAISVSGAILLMLLFVRPSPVQICVRDHFAPKASILLKATKLAIPIALERATISSGDLMCTSLVTGLGTTSIAAHQLASTGESLCFLPAFGFATATTMIIAQFLGSGNLDGAVRSGRTSIIMAVGLMLISGTVMFFAAEFIVGFFTSDKEVIALGAKMLQIEAFAEPLLAVGVVSGGIFRGAGDIRCTIGISAAGMWLVRIPAAYVLIHLLGWNLSAVWVAMILDWAVRSSLSLIYFHTGRWSNAYQTYN